MTAAALMIGLGLVSLRLDPRGRNQGLDQQAIDASFAGNLIIENTSSRATPAFPTGIPAALAGVPGVGQVTPIAFTEGRVKGLGGTQSITAVDPAEFARVYRIDWDRGSNATLASLGTTGTVLTKTFANAHHLPRRRPPVGADPVRAHDRAGRARASRPTTPGCSPT